MVATRANTMRSFACQADSRWSYPISKRAVLSAGQRIKSGVAKGNLNGQCGPGSPLRSHLFPGS